MTIVESMNVILEDKSFFSISGISHMDLILKIINDYPGDLYFFYWRGYLENINKRRKLKLDVYSRKFFWFKTIQNLAKLGLMEKPRPYQNKHNHFEHIKYPISSSGKKIHKIWEKYGLWNFIENVPREYFSNINEFNYYVKEKILNEEKIPTNQRFIPEFCKICLWFGKKDQKCYVDQVSGEIYEDFNEKGLEECFQSI